MDPRRPHPAGPGPSGAVARARALFAAGRAGEAERALADAARRNPANVEVAVELGVLLQRTRKFEASVRELRRAATLAPNDPRVHLVLGQALRLAGYGDDALVAFQRAAALAPKHKGIRCAIAETQDHLHRVEEALESVNEALRLDPSDPFARVLGARIYRRSGNLERARALLEGALAVSPPLQIVVQANFELGRVLDRLGEFDAAFEAFTRANAAQAETPRAKACDAGAIFRRIEAYGRVSIGEIAEWGAQAPPDDAIPAAFLVGFPRSGTTLTEQMLSANGSIGGTDEEPLLHRALGVIESRARGTPIDDVIRTAPASSIQEARGRYRELVRASLDEQAGTRLLVDKYPLNMIEAAFMARAMPDGRIVVVLRDPRDVCLSCFQQAFQPNPATVNCHSIESTAALYEAVMGLWLRQRDALPLGVIEIRYEDTVRDAPSVARRLAEFLGVEWDDEMLRFHAPEHRRFITTPSNEAVSEPVHSRAVGRWHKYESHFAPVLSKLEPYIRAFGYES